MIQIRKLSPDKWKEYRNLRLEALKKDPSSFGSSYDKEKKLSPSEWKRKIENALFALSGDKPIGMIKFLFSKEQETKHVAKIYGLYVNKEYRNQGVGRKLLKSTIAEIKKNNRIIKIVLNVNPQQKKAASLYEKEGFEKIGKLKKDIFVNGKFYDSLVMEKYL